MSKLKSDEIRKEDISEFLEKESDFSFEMQVLHKMDEMGFVCQHGGTYTDPITEKRREFDIRAHLRHGKFSLSLAIECKNIKANFPLLISCVERRVSEAFHDLIVFTKGFSEFSSLLCPETKRISNSSLYAVSTSVAKKVEQIGRSASNGNMVGNDTDTFDKLSQAVNSAYDLIRSFASYNDESFVNFTLPVLVVPDNRLWRVDYSNAGLQLGSPIQATHCSLFLDQSWQIDRRVFGSLWYTLSHLEIVTLSAMPDYIKQIFDGTKGAFVGCEELIKG